MYKQEQIFDIHWYGPYELSMLSDMDRENCVLYSIYGTHPTYGRNILLYIGRTKDILDRITQHESWLNDERDPVSVYIAAIGEFESWDKARKTEAYPPPRLEIIDAIEALLIYAHQPVYNYRSKQTAQRAKQLRLFNTGRYGTLLPEVSGIYHVGDLSA
jgi:hypothetical protein